MICATGCASNSGPGAGLLALPSSFEDGTQPWLSPPPGNSRSEEDTLHVTLDQAVELAAARRPVTRAAEDRVLAAEAGSRQARAWRNPEAVMEIEGFGGDRPGLDEAEVTLGLAGGLDLFGRAAAGGRVADATAQMRRAERLTIHRQLSERVRRAFHDVLAAREQLRIADMALDVARDTERAVRSEVAAGKTASLRGIQAETTLETARIRHETARLRLNLARGGLSRLVEGAGAHPRPVAAVGELRSTLPRLDAGTLAEEVISRHPGIARELWMAEIQNRRAHAIGRMRLPELGVSIGYRRNRAEDRSDWVGGLSVELPLFDRKEGAVREAQRLRSAAREEAREATLILTSELERALEASRAAASLLKHYDGEVLPRAARALRLARLGYTEGKFGYLDLTDAEDALVRSQGERTDALIDLDRALTDLDILIGRTLPSPSDTPEE